MKNKISIYIPVFNGAKTIKQSIESINSQTIKFDEIIVVNDCSTDKTLEILRSFKKIKIINNKKNLGLAASRNIAFKNCKNKIVANIDADIVLHKNWLKNILKNLGKKNIIMCGGYTKERYLKNIYNRWRSINYPLNWGNKNLVNPPFLYGSNSIQYRSLWKKVNGYNSQFKTAGDDVNYSKKISLLKKFNTFYSVKAICYHLQNDDLNSLSNRVWRYHSFGYKISNPCIKKFFKLIIKQLKILIIRTTRNILNLNFSYFKIYIYIFLKFVYLEFKNTLN